MKKALSFFLAVIMVILTIPMTARTVSAETDGYYTYTVTYGKATITGVGQSISGDITIPDTLGGYPVTSIGGRAFSSCESLTSVTIPNSVTSIGNSAFFWCTSLTSVTIPDSVASIGDSAFYNCTSLTSVTIPDSVASIGDSAFYNCTNLTSITIPDSVTSIGDYSFYNCKSLTSVTIPDSVTSIGHRAFENCTSLTSVTIPDSVTSIGGRAFYNCRSLTSITIPDSVTSIGDSAFAGCKSLTSITIPDSVTSIGERAFYYCTSLGTVTIGNGVTSIGWGAFESCTGLESVTIGNGVTSIVLEAFKNCTSLTSVTIPDSVKNIYANAFENCTSLGTVTIGNGLTAIESGTFQNCTSLSSVTIGNGVTSIWWSAFENCTSLTDINVSDNNTAYKSIDGVVFSKDGTTLIIYPFGKTLSDYTIPDGVTSIVDRVFQNCTSLTSVTIPDSMTSIGNEAFYNCTSLSSVTIGNGLTSIGDWTFYNCTSLSSVTIPDSVTSIGGYAFYNCTNLTSVTIPDSVTSIGDRAFEDCTNLTSITIPDSVTSIGIQAFSWTGYYNDSSNWENYALYIGNYLIKAKDTISGTYEIKYGTITIAGSAFEGCESLKSVTIPDSVTSIGDSAFYYCSSLTSVTIPASVTRIGDNAFDNCSDDLVILCNIGSYAATYAADNNISFIYLNTPKDLSIASLPNKLVYHIGGTLDLSGLSLSVTYEDGTTVSVIAGYTVSDYDFSTAGTKVITVSIGELSASFEVVVDPNLVVLPESEHPYANNTNQTWNYTHPTDVDRLVITFSEDTETEEGYDYIYIYDVNGNQVGVYSGTELAGASITVDGNQFSIKLTTDGSATANGFTVVSVEAIGHTYGEWIVRTEPTCTVEGLEYRICSVCGNEETRAIAAIGHDLVFHDAQAPTCTEIGWQAYDTCTRCDYTTYEEIPATGHSYENGVCTVCGEKKDFILGDVNGDGSVNNNDVTLLRRFLSGSSTVSIKVISADMDSDGKITNVDYTLLLRVMKGA